MRSQVGYMYIQCFTTVKTYRGKKVRSPKEEGRTGLSLLVGNLLLWLVTTCTCNHHPSIKKGYKAMGMKNILLSSYFHYNFLVNLWQSIFRTKLAMGRKVSMSPVSHSLVFVLSHSMKIVGWGIFVSPVTFFSGPFGLHFVNRYKLFIIHMQSLLSLADQTS